MAPGKFEETEAPKAEKTYFDGVAAERARCAALCRQYAGNGNSAVAVAARTLAQKIEGGK